MDRQGLGNLNLQDLARDLGTKAPSLYNHIRSLGELREEVALATFGRLEDLLRDAAVGRSGKAALGALAEAYRTYSLAHPRLYLAIVELAGTGTSGPVREGSRHLIGTLNRVLEPYGLDSEGITHFSRGFRSALHGFVTMELLGFNPEPEPAKSFRRLVEALTASLDDLKLWNCARGTKEIL